MKKNTTRMKNQSLFCLFPIVLIVSTSMTPAFFPIEQQFNKKYTFSHALVEHLSMKNLGDESGWPLTYHHDNEDIATAVLIDKDNQIIASGYTFNYSNYNADFLTVKYNEFGNLLWAEIFDGGTYDYSWDATVDSQGNVIILGFNSTLEENPEELDITLFIVKYDANGIIQWNKTLAFEKDCFPGGLAVDSEDNIILTLGSGDLDTIEFFCQTLKYDEQGNEIWNTTFTEDMISFGADVVINEKDEIFICGLTASFFGQGWFIINYDTTGTLKWVQRYAVGNQPFDIELDPNGNIILTGQEYSYETNSSSWLTLKCDSKGNVIWTYLFDGPANEYPRDSTIDTQGNIYTVGTFVRDNNSQTCVIKQNPNGDEQCIKFQSYDEAFLCITIDKDDQVIGSGAINATTGDTFNSDFYTDIITDFTPPEFTIEQPKPGYIYLFDKPLFPLGKNALIIGPVTIRLTPDDPDEISHIEFYIDGNLMEIKTSPPFEYFWDESRFGEHTIEIHVYNNDLNMKHDEKSVWKIW